MQKKTLLMILIPLLILFMASGCMESIVKPTAKTDTGEEMQLPPYSGLKAKVAVADFEWKVGGRGSTIKISGFGGQSITVTHQDGYMTGLRDMLTTAMVQSKRYRVLERQNLGSLKQFPGLNPITLEARVEPAGFKEQMIQTGIFYGANVFHKYLCFLWKGG